MSDDHSARLALPYLAAGQMQKHVTLNEALTRLDAIVQTVVASRTTTAQPGAPDDGSLWILPPAATGSDWSTRPGGALVRAEGGGWTVVEVGEGLIALVADADEVVVRHGGNWVELGARLGVAQALDRLGVGTTADAANPFAARLNTALWTALEAAAGAGPGRSARPDPASAEAGAAQAGSVGVNGRRSCWAGLWMWLWEPAGPAAARPGARTEPTVRSPWAEPDCWPRAAAAGAVAATAWAAPPGHPGRVHQPRTAAALPA